ncbi:putative nucleotide-diphospho-sugar transferase [Roseovarius sp. ZX-A-9]|uniref:putative nucleotide-diphospho-sugar transferase n=1 Tax=Roseovarius sp. ZX-A-9 TaxID=3014783 RepID=UPI0023310A7B|nr:putative nucleotide-diphospho-sugar transferase [Roseovarius sp. ZX-A-9]
MSTVPDLPAPRGVVFVATGARYIACAEAAARSVRRHMPDVPIALFTDAGQLGLSLSGVFDPVIELESVHHRSKVDCLMNSPFERTLFLDADIRVLEDVGELFDLLDRFDVAMAHAHARNRDATRAVWKYALPDSFPQFNTGVIAVRRNPQTQALLKNWSDSYKKAGFRKDQVTLRELLWASDLRLATLPPEYNIRYPKNLWLWSRREARPRICHFYRYSFAKRSDWLRALAKRLIGWPRRVASRLRQQFRKGKDS